MAWLPSQYAWAQPQAAVPQSWWNGITSGLSSNSGLLLGLGAGLLSGNLGAVPGAIAQGAESDRSRNLQSYQLALQAQQRQAAAKWASQMGHPEWAPAAEAGGLSIGDMFAATRPVAISGDGYLADPTTGKPAMWSSGGGAAPSGGNGIYRPMTADERKSLGVGPNDPYMVNNATGKPVYVGNPTSVNINNQGESAYAKQRGQDIAADMKTMQNSRMTAYGTLGQLDLLKSALDNTYQGTGGQTVQKLKKLAGSLGIDVSGVADGDLANSISNNLALQLRNPSGGAGMPGAMSDSDRAFLSSMAPGLANSPGGNALMIEAAKRVQQRNIDVAKLATKYAHDHNGQLDDNFYTVLSDYAEQHPLFADLQQAAAPTPAAPSPKQGVTKTYTYNPATGQLE